MTGLEVLVKARELISDPERWTHGVYARDAKGESCFDSSDEATCFDALGALNRVSGTRMRARTSASSFLYEAIDSVPSPYSIGEINDQLGHEATLKIFDRAIELATKEAKK